MKQLRLWMVSLAVACVACSTTDAPDPKDATDPADSPTPDTGPDPGCALKADGVFEIGINNQHSTEASSFKAIADGDTVDVVLGPQFSYMLVAAARTDRFPDCMDSATVEIQVGELATAKYKKRPFFASDGAARMTLNNYAVLAHDGAWHNSEVALTIALETEDGERVEATATVTLNKDDTLPWEQVGVGDGVGTGAPPTLGTFSDPDTFTELGETLVVPPLFNGGWGVDVGLKLADAPGPDELLLPYARLSAKDGTELGQVLFSQVAASGEGLVGPLSLMLVDDPATWDGVTADLLVGVERENGERQEATATVVLKKGP